MSSQVDGYLAAIQEQEIYTNEIKAGKEQKEKTFSMLVVGFAKRRLKIFTKSLFKAIQ